LSRGLGDVFKREGWNLGEGWLVGPLEDGTASPYRFVESWPCFFLAYFQGAEV
jgi:hypothetical protein